MQERNEDCPAKMMTAQEFIYARYKLLIEDRKRITADEQANVAGAKVARDGQVQAQGNVHRQTKPVQRKDLTHGEVDQDRHFIDESIRIWHATHGPLVNPVVDSYRRYTESNLRVWHKVQEQDVDCPEKGMTVWEFHQARYPQTFLARYFEIPDYRKLIQERAANGGDAGMSSSTMEESKRWTMEENKR